MDRPIDDKVEFNVPNPGAIEIISARIERVKTLRIDEIRQHWQIAFKKPAPKSLSRDLLTRMIAWRMQEDVDGGHDRATLAILKCHARNIPSAARAVRYMRPGTELIREYQGVRHTVTITSAGFCWRDKTYRSLSAIARAITGMNWNGPRFFGLRVGELEDVRRSEAAKKKTGGRAREERIQ